MSLLMGLSIGFALSLLVAFIFENQCLATIDQGPHGNFPDISENPVTFEEGETFELHHRTIKVSIEEQEQNRQKYLKMNRISRPRFLSSEVGMKEKLFTGVLTSAKSVESFGVAINKTLNHILPRLTFFMNNPGALTLAGMPLVLFSDDKRHMAPFHMFKYVADHYVNAYDWFFIFPDTTYVRGVNLMDFVQHISVAENLLVGRPVESENEKSMSCDFQAGILNVSGISLKLIFFHTIHILCH